MKELKELSNMTKTELEAYVSKLTEQYNEQKSLGMKLDMSRGKPCKEQLDLSMKILDFPSSTDSYLTTDNTDARNYSTHVDGLPEAKRLLSKIAGVDEKEIIVGGNSSLNLMFDSIARLWIKGAAPGITPWSSKKTKFICPSPGYDRHFAICEYFGIEMITVEMKSDGPDMDKVEELVSVDEDIRGIWCVPMYSNPEGITFSDSVVERFSKLKPKAQDFRIFWDNAYSVHHLYDEPDRLLNLLTLMKKNGNEDLLYMYGSTSKISFAGAGLAFMAASENNISFIRKQMGIQTIGPDKINQLRHVAFFKDMDGINQHMKKHAEILKPKFELVLNVLEKELGGLGAAKWNSPKGGYFISLNVMEGCAKKVVSMAKEAGVTLTGAGATYPYGKDPLDRNIRIAPTFPPLSELSKAINLLCLCVKLASAQKLMSEKLP